MCIRDRYYNDLLVDPKRYRLGITDWFVRVARFFIPKPDISLILTAEAQVIYNRKQEVSLIELKRQVKEYRSLSNNKDIINIDVNKSPEKIVIEIKQILMKKMNERY